MMSLYCFVLLLQYDVFWLLIIPNADLSIVLVYVLINVLLSCLVIAHDSNKP